VTRTTRLNPVVTDRDFVDRIKDQVESLAALASPTAMAVLGDSHTETAGGPGVSADHSPSALVFGLSYLGWPFDIAWNYAVGGATSAQILASVDDALYPADPAYRPGIVYFDGGANDAALTVTETIDNLQGIADAVLAAGATAVYQGMSPVDSPTSGQLLRMNTANGWARQQSQRRPRFVFADIAPAVIDPVTGALRADCSTSGGDVVHLSPRGKSLAGLAVADALRPLAVKGAPLCPHNGNPTNVCQWSHPPSVSDNPAQGPGYFSGVSAIAAIPGAHWSVADRPGRASKWTQLVLPPSAGAQTIVHNAAYATGVLQSGDDVFFTMEYEVADAQTDAVASGFGISAEYDGTSFMPGIAACLTPNPGEYGPINDRGGVLRTPVFSAPVGAAGSAVLNIRIHFTGGATYRFDSIGMWNLTRNPLIF
jgi:lysophospholipase L1-like esterase